MSTRYRSRAIADSVIAFSVSYHRDNLLARGMGLEHLRELLIRLGRLIVRHGANLAYGGHWRDTDDNLTFDFLRLISAEQEASSLDSDVAIGKLYNHLAWPHYLDVTTALEAQWINTCRIVRVTQQDAGLADADVVPDAEAHYRTREPRTRFNGAVTLSAMRRQMMEPITTVIPDVGSTERIPRVVARVALGGNVDSYSGFVPGILEEALVTLEHGRPTYLLGGFGGATEILAKAVLAEGEARPPELTPEWHRTRNARLAALLQTAGSLPHPKDVRSTADLLDALFEFVKKARAGLAQTLQTGLTDDDTRQLMTTRDVATAVRLVWEGLQQSLKIPALPA